MGNALYRQGKVADSIEIYKKILTLDNDEPEKVWVNLGNSYADLHNQADATKAFNKALELKPGFASAYMGLGRMYCEHDRMDDAERELQNAVKSKPDYASAYYYLGRVEIEKGKYREARTALDNSLRYEENQNTKTTFGRC